jgi:hypothetical protein
MKIGELFIQLGFEADTMKLKDFVRSIGDLNMSSIIATGAWGEFASITKSLLEGTAGLAQEMRFFTETTGLSAQRMQSWSQLARQLGLDGNIVAQTLKHLQTSIQQTKLGNVDQGLMQAYSLLNIYGKAGIDISQEYFTQLENIRKGLLNLNPEMYITLTQLGGLNEQMISFLTMQEKDWALRDKQPVIRPADIERMKEMNMEWVKLTQEMTILGNQFAIEIAPVIISTTKALVDLLKELKSFVNQDLFKKIMGGLNTVGQIGMIPGRLEMGLITGNPKYFQDIMNWGKTPAAVTNNNNVNFNIQGDNPREIADQVNKSIKEILSDTHYQMPAVNY